MLVFCTLCLIFASIKAASEVELKEIAQDTYKKVLPCLLSSWTMNGRNQSDFLFPSDAEEHFQDIFEKTKAFREIPIHYYANYEGPWVENLFILNYSTKPLSFFNGFIPIFVQWIDTQILRGKHFDHLHHTLNQVLRPNVLYLAISQGDVGLGKIGVGHPNIFVFSAGGFGHSVIPLIRSELPWNESPTQFKNDIGFFGTGNQHQSNRPAMLEIIKSAAENLHMSYRQGQGEGWIKDMQGTKFNLAPRGYGRSSFRFAESIQMGCIPVFLYDDYPWIPYLGTHAGVLEFGFMGGYYDKNFTLVDLVKQLKGVSDSEYSKKLKHLKKIRHLFTYEGLFGQLELFLIDPFGINGGFLKCGTHPRTERCCG